MSDRVFRDMRGQMKPDPDLLRRLDRRLAAEAAGSAAGPGAAEAGERSDAAPRPGRWGGRRRPGGSRGPGPGGPRAGGGAGGRAGRARTAALSGVAGFAAGALVLTLAWGGADRPAGVPKGLSTPAAAHPKPTGGASPSSGQSAQPEFAAGDYGEIYAAVSGAWTASGAYGNDGFYLREDAAMEDAAAAPEADSGSRSKAGSDAGYSETNAQVAGIDEADVAKTDGKSIFVASRREVVILAAAGRQTRELARIDVSAPAGGEDGGEDGLSLGGEVFDLYVAGFAAGALVLTLAWGG
ncbi:MAG: beta-propeller domain-containing protein, partial [Bifidobacteriaceae bacterium]|nr:beta-propeller domain-containing protein [Bifidobacteriaceae bacterium]